MQYAACGSFDVVSLGEVVVDAFQIRESPLSFSFFPGGASVNVAVALARLGVASAVMGKVGADPFGEFLRDALRAEGVEEKLCFSSRERTSLTFVFGKQDPYYLRYSRSDLDLSPQDVDWTLFQYARVVHLVSLDFVAAPIREVSEAVLRHSREQDIFVFFDFNHRPAFWEGPDEARKVVWALLPEVDFLKLNYEEFLLLSGKQELEPGAEVLLAQGVRNLAVTLGEGGVFFASALTQGKLPSFSVLVADVVGCGDAFCAGVLRVLLKESMRKGLAIPPSLFREAVLFGAACGALTASRRGAFPAFPRLGEVEKFLRESPPLF
ncbi:carbohydrate kinase [Thermatribacter velox]|uniref:Carbohydrate kinase n=1 Tax=Thermatribacter velox TaxID=3039681 RepID=A0ABZ2Y9B7_9BACT